MAILKIVNTDKVPWYWIAYSIPNQIIHNGILLPGQTLKTGQPSFEYFYTAEEAIARAAVLGFEIYFIE